MLEWLKFRRLEQGLWGAETLTFEEGLLGCKLIRGVAETQAFEKGLLIDAGAAEEWGGGVSVKWHKLLLRKSTATARVKKRNPDGAE